MEGYAVNIIKNYHLFFILGASEDDLAKKLRKIAIQVAMRTNSSIEYLLNLPINDLFELVEDINEIDRARKEANGK